jgi:hypothetical protein
MILLQYENGNVISFLGIAALIEQEGKLGRGDFYNPANGLRCAMGVIEQHQNDYRMHCPMIPRSKRNLTKLFQKHIEEFGVSHANDRFSGSPEKRAKYMAKQFRRLHFRVNVLPYLPWWKKLFWFCIYGRWSNA